MCVAFYLLPCAGAAERVSVVSVVPVGVLVPSGKSVHVHPLSRQTHPHVTVPALGHDLDLENTMVH